MMGVPSSEFMRGFKFARSEALKAHTAEEDMAESANRIGKARSDARELAMEENAAWSHYDAAS